MTVQKITQTSNNDQSCYLKSRLVLNGQYFFLSPLIYLLNSVLLLLYDPTAHWKLISLRNLWQRRSSLSSFLGKQQLKIQELARYQVFASKATKKKLIPMCDLLK